MKVILFQPQIPQNTGNIIRTCAATNTDLVLVKPLGFSTSDRKMKRAGLDYFEHVSLDIVDEFEEYLSSPFYFFSSKASKSYYNVKYAEDCTLIFGNETTGLPNWIHNRWTDRFVTIPMHENARCLNLSNAVAIALYEARRQIMFSSKTPITPS